MGIEFVELSASHSVAPMPVEGNRQLVGLLHGGAYVVLGESLGSHLRRDPRGPGRSRSGIEINATHTRSVTDGWVTGTCEALHSRPHALTTHEIVVRDEQGRRCSTVRITNMLRDARLRIRDARRTCGVARSRDAVPRESPRCYRRGGGALLLGARAAR